MTVQYMLVFVCLSVGSSAYRNINWGPHVSGGTQLPHEGAGSYSSSPRVLTPEAPWLEAGIGGYNYGSRAETPKTSWSEGWVDPYTNVNRVVTPQSLRTQQGFGSYSDGFQVGSPDARWHQGGAQTYSDSPRVITPQAPWGQGSRHSYSDSSQVITPQASWPQRGGHSYSDSPRVVTPQSQGIQAGFGSYNGGYSVGSPVVPWYQGTGHSYIGSSQAVAPQSPRTPEGFDLYNGGSRVWTPDATNLTRDHLHADGYRVEAPEAPWIEGGNGLNTTNMTIKDRTMPNTDDGNVPVEAYVAGGTRVNGTESPWHVGIYEKTISPFRQKCGGTIIAKNVVLTAAHCFSQEDTRPTATNYAVAAGKIYRPWDDPNDKDAQKAEVVSIHIPPRYVGSLANFQEDIAVMVLDKDFTYGPAVRPACLNFDANFDNDQLRKGRLGKVVGWGLTGENSGPSQVLQGAFLPSINIEECITDTPRTFKSLITADKICAGYDNGTAVCSGDSGGGLLFPMVVDTYTRWYLRGLVSTSLTSENDACNIYTWATFTHVLRQEHFIKSIVPNVEENCIEYDAKGNMRAVSASSTN